MILKLLRQPCAFIESEFGNYRHYTLLDTGASVSVCTHGLEVLHKLYPEAEKTNLVKNVHAVGKDYISSPIYRIPIFHFGDLNIHNLPVALVDDKGFFGQFVLSSYLFRGHKFSIDYDNCELEIPSLKHYLECRFYPSKYDSKQLGKVQVFAISSDMKDKPGSDVLTWCRANATDAIKDLPDDELWDYMKESYEAFGRKDQ